jgi:hypothetical protein
VFSDSEDSVRVDSQGRLHLRIVRDGSRWNCAEIVSRREFGRGTYRFFVATTPRRLAPGPVLGLFTYSDDPASAHREVDVELSSAAPDGTDAQFVVQPGADEGTFRRFRLPADAEDAVYSFRVLPGRVEFAGGSAAAPDAFESWTSSAAPDGGGANVRMNLWLARGVPPADGAAVEAVVSRFEFVPSN